MSTSVTPPFAQDSRDIALWIESDSHLRDEAVLFGWASPTDIQKKTESIESYYRRKVEESKRDLTRITEQENTLKQRLGELASDIVSSTQRLAQDEQKVKDANAARRDTYDLPRYGLGVVLGALICIFNYFVIFVLLGGGTSTANTGTPQTGAAGSPGAVGPAGFDTPFPSEYTIWVALGITLLGMFTLFSPVSVLFRSNNSPGDTTDAPEPGKAWVAEIVPAVAAAFFTVVWGWEPTLLHTIASFIFIATLFIFAGKLLLSLLPRLTVAIKQSRAHRDLLRAVEANQAAHRKLLERGEQLRADIEDLQDRKQELPSEEELKETCEHKIRLFTSEAEFARAATRHLMGIDAEQGVVQPSANPDETELAPTI